MKRLWNDPDFWGGAIGVVVAILLILLFLKKVGAFIGALAVLAVALLCLSI